LRKKQKLDKGAEQKKRKRKGQQAEKDENDEEEGWAVGCGLWGWSQNSHCNKKILISFLVFV